MGGIPAPRFFAEENGQLSPIFMGQLSGRIDVILAEAQAQAVKYLQDNRAILDRLADLLIERRTLAQEDLAAFFVRGGV